MTLTDSWTTHPWQFHQYILFSFIQNRVMTKTGFWKFIQKSVQLRTRYYVKLELKLMIFTWMSFPDHSENWKFGKIFGWIFQNLLMRAKCKLKGSFMRFNNGKLFHWQLWPECKKEKKWIIQWISRFKSQNFC